MTKGQEAAMKKQQTREAEQRREANLAAMAKEEALRHTHEEKILRQVRKHSRPRTLDTQFCSHTFL
jgi:hypothetical protein